MSEGPTAKASEPDTARTGDVDPAGVIAEFNALRAEISQRSTAQLACLTASLASGGLAFTTLADGATTTILLPSILSPCFGLLWVDHASQIFNIAKYIKKDLALQHRTIPLKWEAFANRFSVSPGRVHELGLPSLLIFAVPAILSLALGIGLILPADEGGHWYDALLLTVGLALTGIFMWSWWSAFQAFRGRQS